jgi:RimJ/RimL family protein N-acetyltransferase
MYGPVIQGKVARLRPLRVEEAEQMIAWFEDVEVTRTILRRFPPSLNDEKEWIEKLATSPNDIIWAIEYEGRLVGTTGVHGIDWPNQHGTTGTLIGDRSAWGKGLGSEVMQLRARFVFTETTLQKLNSGYLDGNTASARAQAHCGYVEIGRMRKEYFRDGKWIDQIMTELLREDWEKANSV